MKGYGAVKGHRWKGYKGAGQHLHLFGLMFTDTELVLKLLLLIECLMLFRDTYPTDLVQPHHDAVRDLYLPAPQ